MRREFAEVLRSPGTAERLELIAAEHDGAGEIVTGHLLSPSGGRFPIERAIPRFVAPGNYTGSFGLQWNRFRATQLDSHSGTRISHDRFYSFTGWSSEELAGKLVLDAGCGSGRFTEIALAAGATVVAVDYSTAIDACRENFRGHPRLHLAQADLTVPPFSSGTFDYVYCLGVLQHTPSPRDTFAALARLVARGGKLAIDVYPALRRNILWPKYWLRPFTKRVPPTTLFRAVERATPWLLRASRAISRVPGIGRRLRYAVPVADYRGVYPLGEQQLRDWAVLDTFDMLAPQYDRPQTAREVRSWFHRAGFAQVTVERRGFIVGRGTAPA